MTSTSETSVSQWSMATHPQYDNARKRKLREERDSRSMVPLDSGTTDNVAAVRLSGGTAIDPRKTAFHPPKPDVDGFGPAPNSDGQGHGNGGEEQMGPPSIKLEPVEENNTLVHDTHGSLSNNALDHPGQIPGQLGPITDYELDWKSGEIDRRERELERRERELERRERELDRRERAFDDEKMRWAVIHYEPTWLGKAGKKEPKA